MADRQVWAQCVAGSVWYLERAVRERAVLSVGEWRAVGAGYPLGKMFRY